MKKLLIVDDEEDMVWTLQKNLGNKELDVDIVTAHSGEEALERLKETPVDLIITDIRMPGINGLDLLLTVKQNYPNTGVIVMTAYPNPEYKKDASYRGCLHFVEKPFDMNELREIVKNVVDNNRGFKGTIAGIELTDIIQINCLSRATAALKVKTLDKEGMIFFKEGNIVHAVSGVLEGADAFYSILQFEGGTLESTKGAEAPAITIEKGYEALLMEGMRRLDETKRNKGNDEKLQDDALLTKQKAKEIVERFAAIDGVTVSCVVKNDGFVIESMIRSDIDSELVGAITSKAFSVSQSLVKHLAESSLEMNILEYKEGSIIISPLIEDSFLIVVTGEDTNIVTVMAEVKKLKEEE